MVEAADGTVLGIMGPDGSILGGGGEGGGLFALLGLDGGGGGVVRDRAPISPRPRSPPRRPRARLLSPCICLGIDIVSLESSSAAPHVHVHVHVHAHVHVRCVTPRGDCAGPKTSVWSRPGRQG